MDTEKRLLLLMTGVTQQARSRSNYNFRYTNFSLGSAFKRIY